MDIDDIITLEWTSRSNGSCWNGHIKKSILERQKNWVGRVLSSTDGTREKNTRKEGSRRTKNKVTLLNNTQDKLQNLQRSEEIGVGQDMLENLEPRTEMHMKKNNVIQHDAYLWSGTRVESN